MSDEITAVELESMQTRMAINKGKDPDAKIEHMLNLERHPQMVHVRFRDGQLELVMNIGLGPYGERSLKLPDEIMNKVLALTYV